ncbi:MAG TPA: uroporphyrinogen decarboxylase family protein [Spirochaetia bacterium]|nr:uroporphyrinogen decarboxylase family protein [Spirochaetia bacterium]
MKELTGEQRILRVLDRQEPDRVPHFEWAIDRKVREALAPGCGTLNGFAARMGLDAALADPDFRKDPAGPGRWRSEWGYVLQDSAEEHGIEVESPIHTMADFERYSPPDLRAPGRYDTIEKTISQFGGSLAVIVHLNDVFSLPRYLMGYENLLMAVAAEPELVTALVTLSVDVNLAMAREAAARGAKIVYTGDDFAGETGPLMSPAHFRALFYPGLCRVVQGYKALGLKVIKHTDGMIWPLIDMIVDSGIDCLDPIDPMAGMDLAEVKRKYGTRVALKGNVDCAHLMTLGSPAKVEEATREALRVGMPGGGFILSSSNSIHSSVKPENYLAMLTALRAHGKYRQ